MLTERMVRSAATDDFRAAIEAYLAGREQDRIEVAGYAPAIKVQRVLTMLLEQFPEHPIERVQVDGSSGCSNFTGSLRVEPGDLEIRFDWDCAWKAREAGLLVYGYPDQQRAAREYGYDCFRVFEVVD